MKDGSVKMNPGHLNPDAIKPAGPTDPELQILVARNKDTKKTIAVYANLALHYVGNGKSLSVSADYFGEYAKALQRIAGEDFLVILANGCQGNINNLDFSKPSDIKRLLPATTSRKRRSRRNLEAMVHPQGRGLHKQSNG